MPAVYLLTGISAAGKSTVAEALAHRFPRGVHVHGDAFRCWIVRGRVDMAPGADGEAVDQLRLRYRLLAGACDAYWAAGFTVVAQDVVLGPHLAETAGLITARPLHVIVLDPDPEVVARRESARAKSAYAEHTIGALAAVLRTETPRIGHWLDTSRLSVTRTVEEVLRVTGS